MDLMNCEVHSDMRSGFTFYTKANLHNFANINDLKICKNSSINILG